MSNAELALTRLPAESGAREQITSIDNAACRAADLCRQLLAYAGKGKSKVTRVDLTELVRDTADLLDVSISKKVRIEYDMGEDLPLVEGDVTQIRQVLMNLVVNASEAIGTEHALITVTTGVQTYDERALRETYLGDGLPPGSYVVLTVSDTGCGMDAETQQRIFDPFFTTKFTGRGLGLAAVVGIMRAHQGAIRVDSTPGRGSTIKVLLASVGASRRETEPAVAPEKDWRGEGMVLLVDDEEVVRKVAGRMLEHIGFEVLTAANGKEAVRLFHEKGDEVDLVLLDMTMPGLSGAEVFERIREVRSDARVILSSGYDEDDAMTEFVGKGLAGFIQKPYRIDELREKARDVLKDPPVPLCQR